MTSTLVRKHLDRACPICDGLAGEIIHTQRFVLPAGHPLAGGYDVVRCAACGFAFADTGTGQREYDDFYAQASRYADGKTTTGGGESAWDARRLMQTAADIARHVPDRQARIADIGCATGGLLRALQALGYNNLCGIDPSPSCVAQVSQVGGIDAAVGSLSEIPTSAGPFDCVILSHVLEHVRDLRPALDHLRTSLRPGGLLFAEVPDATRYADLVVAPFQDFNTEHINHFSVVSLENLLMRTGFRPVDRGDRLISSAADAPYPAIYVFGAAEPAGREVAPAPVVDESLGACLIEYVRVSRQLMRDIDARLQGVLPSSQEVIVWGTGQLTMKLLAETSLAAARIVAFVDGNPVNQGRLLNGIPILAPAQLEPGTNPIVVASILHHAAIVEDIRMLGLPNPVVELRPRPQVVSEKFT